VKEYTFLTSLRFGDVENLPTQRDFKTRLSFLCQENLNTSYKEMYKVELSSQYSGHCVPELHVFQ